MTLQPGTIRELVEVHHTLETMIGCHNSIMIFLKKIKNRKKTTKNPKTLFLMYFQRLLKELKINF